MRASVLLGGLVALLTSSASAAELGGINPDEMRSKAREAFARGDYEAMAQAYQPMADWSLGQCHDAVKAGRIGSMGFDDCFGDCLGLAHAYQLAENWPSAVGAYQSVLGVILAALKAEPAGAEGRPLPAVERSNHERDYARLIRLIGVIQRDELKDPQAAAATLAKAADFCPVLKGSFEELEAHFLKRLGELAASRQVAPDTAWQATFLYPHRALRELAVTQEQLGQPLAAIETWLRLSLTRSLSRGAGVSSADIVPLRALIHKLPAGQALPRIPVLLTLSPLAPTLDLNLDDPKTLVRSCGGSGRGAGDYWLFALCPPRGQEFATLDFACDIEQTDPRFGGQLSCWAPTKPDGTGRAHIGSVGWAQKPPGRAVVSQAFEVPPGADLVYVEAGISPGKFRTHRVTAKATFRPWEDLATRKTPVRPKANAWVQTECLPAGGILRRDGEAIEAGNALRYPVPGRYTFTYTAPAHPETRTCELALATDGRYGLFINLDSPFRWKLTDLRGFAQHPPARASLVRLADRRWLAAYGSREKKVLLSTSADGAKWDKPWQLPHTSIGDSIEPTLHLSRDGTLWLAYFNNRLDWPPWSTGGYQLWLTSSRDGRDWSRPRPVLVTVPTIRVAFWREFGTIGGSPCGAAEFIEGPNGRHWLFWRTYVASADTPEGIREFQPIQFEGGGKLDSRTVHPAIDSAGRLHVVFNSWREGLCYSTSPDGQKWSAPAPLDVAKPGGMFEGAQLILDGPRAALLYEALNGTWLCRGVLDPAPKFDPPVKITNHPIPARGSRACVTPDGQVTILTGDDTIWLLQADRNALCRPVHKF
ncbi:MAG: hypothetical protein FJ291_17070 [Planctomycetes bacterium]|nr:hypothetical protein [Planctomycetota bacterium]